MSGDVALKNFFVNNYVFCPLIYRNYTENFNLGGLAMTDSLYNRKSRIQE